MIVDNSFLETTLLIMTVVGVLFSVYLHFRTPQINNAQMSIKLREDVDSLAQIIAEVKEKHLRAVEQDMKQLTATIGQLSLTVTRLSTIIDERIPKK